MPAIDPLLQLSATRLAALIRGREVSALEVVEAHAARIRRVNPLLNAVVRDRFERARAEARIADEVVRTRDPALLPPFLGVPCTIKECFALTGMPQTSGLVARRGVIAAQDATAVARIRQAGSIPLGVTNVSELCMWMETNNRVYGRTNNPYDPRRIVGGSSGGEGAIIAAGGSPFGIGSDIGGSIRLPAFFNGVFGHKPTGGLVPGSGQYPIAENAALRYLTTGPLARRAEDLMPLLRTIAGPDGIDAGARAQPLGDPGQVAIEQLRVLDVEDNGCMPVCDELRAAQRQAAEALARRGAHVERTRIDGLEQSLEIWGSLLEEAGGTPFSVLLGNGRRANALSELLRWVVGRSPHTLPALILALLERLHGLAPARVARFAAEGRALRERLVARLGETGVMLLPSYPRPAPRHGRPIFRPLTFGFVYTAIVNVLELPATQVPLGLGREGLPLGVQVVGGPGADAVTIAVALELERTFGGWVAAQMEAVAG